MNYPDGLFDYLGVVAFFFLIFPFFYSINRKLRGAFIKKIKFIIASKIDSIVRDSTKNGGYSYTLEDDLKPFGDELTRHLKYEFNFDLIPNLLSISSVVMFFTM